MPIEIRELVIKATIVPEGPSAEHPGAAAGQNNGLSSAEELINTCVEKVLEILKEKNER